MGSKSSRLAVLDYNGVISDDLTAAHEVNMRILEDHGRPRIGYEEWRQASNVSAAECLRSLGVEADPNEINQQYADLYPKVAVGDLAPKLYDDVKYALDFFRREGIDIGMVSNHPQSLIVKELDDFRILGCFNLILGANGQQTPKNERLTHMCEKFETNPGNTIFVEDMTYGIREGKKAGVKTYGVTTGLHTEEALLAEEPLGVYKSLTDLVNDISIGREAF